METLEKIRHTFIGFVTSFLSYFASPFIGQEPIHVVVMALFVVAICKDLYCSSICKEDSAADILYMMIGLLPVVWYHYLWL